jgi:hypothetical protein
MRDQRLVGGGTTTKKAPAESFPAWSVWEVINSISTEQAKFLERCPAVAAALDLIIMAVVRYARTRGVLTDRIKIDLSSMRANGVLVAALDRT